MALLNVTTVVALLGALMEYAGGGDMYQVGGASGATGGDGTSGDGTSGDSTAKLHYWEWHK